ncbi:MAG: YhfC family glutamic-type intramembrane protease [Mobilicoccus sp.]|nr:YhfC family glutamic-type intramembrane protease [Mobilicoccus sp.]
MTPIALLSSQLVVVIAGVLICWIVAVRVLPTRWAHIGWGALAFPLSQVLRFALIIPLTLALTPLVGEQIALVSTIILVITSGVFEESTRWLVLRWWARDTRSWRDGIGFGLGHGGIEAILVIGGGVLTAVSLMLAVDVARAAAREQGADALAQVDAQLAAIENLSGLMVGMGLYERVLAIVFHVAMTLFVLRTVRSGRRRYWAIAVVAHIAFNAIAVGYLAALGPEASADPTLIAGLYAILTAIVAVLVWMMWRGPVSQLVVETTHPDPRRRGDTEDA